MVVTAVLKKTRVNCSLDKRMIKISKVSVPLAVGEPVNSKLNWNDNLAAIFEAKLTFKRPSSSVPFYCICRPGRHHFLEMYRDLMFLY